jgi:hypothetical protein
MSDINLDFTVSNNSIDFTVETNDITITPTDVQLTFSTNSLPLAGGTNQQVQYNNLGLLDGDNGLLYTDSIGQLSVTKVLAGDLAATGNVQLGGYIASNVNIQAVSLITNSANLGNVANVKIGGGTNGYVLQTDGTGNLDWTAMTGGGGNGAPGGSNTQIQYNDAGIFGGNTGFTFNEVSGNVTIPGNLSVTGNILGTVATSNFAAYAGNITISAQPNITSVGTLTSANISGTLSIFQGIENVSLIGAQTGTYNYDLLNGAIQYSTANATANIVLNYRGNSSIATNALLANGKSITSTYILTNGANAYGISNVQIDSTLETIKWVGNATPSVISNALQSYTFTIIKTSTTPTYVVLGSMTRYG